MPAEWREPMSVASPKPFCQQRHATEDEGAHEQVAELGIALHQPAQPVEVDAEDLARFAHAAAHEVAAACERVDLAGELAGAVDGDEVIAGDAGVDDLEGAGEDDVDALRRLALLEHDLAGGDRAALGDLGDARELRARERGEHLCAAVVDNVAHATFVHAGRARG